MFKNPVGKENTALPFTGDTKGKGGKTTILFFVLYKLVPAKMITSLTIPD